MTLSLGDESSSVTKTTGWNRDTDINTGSSIGWGNQQWGAVGLSQALTGQALTSGLGTVSNTTDQNISVTGVSTTSSIGTFSITGDSQVTVVAASEPKLDISVGTAEADPEFVVFPKW